MTAQQDYVNSIMLQDAYLMLICLIRTAPSQAGSLSNNPKCLASYSRYKQIFKILQVRRQGINLLISNDNC